MPIETTITVYKPSEKMPERWKTVLVAGGVAVWTGTEWRSRTGVPDERPIAWQVQWWADAPDELEIASRLSRAPVKPDEDPFRLRSHAALYRAACGLRDSLGLIGSIHVACNTDHDYCEEDGRYADKPRISWNVAFLLAPWHDGQQIIGVSDLFEADPQRAFDEFERLMRQRFAPPVPVPAGIEACDGSSLTENGNG